MKIVIYSCLLLSFITGCNKILNTTPNDFIAEKDYYETEAQLTSAIAGVYSQLYRSGNSMYGLFYPAVLTTQADEMLNRNDPSGAYSVVSNLHDNSNSQINDFWNISYAAIERANVLLENMPKAKGNVDSAVYNSIRGEALFLRAYFHFLLVQNFGEIPIKIRKTNGVLDINIKKSSIKEVYAQIIKDMTEAESLVYPTYSQFSNTSLRATKTIVEGILARVCLYMAGYPLNDKTMYAESLKWSDKVIASGIHSLNTAYELNPINVRGSVGDSLMYNARNGNPGYINNPFSQVFLYQSRNENFIAENMWETNPIANIAYTKGTNIGGQFGGPQCGSNYNVLGRVSNQSLTTQNLYVAYANGDLRRDWTCAPYSWSSALQPVRTFTTATSFTNGNLNARPIAKWRREYEPFSTGYTEKSSWATSLRYPFLRYSDVLLMNAEAEVNVNGTTSKAYDDINQVRRRAFAVVNGTSPIRTITLTNGGSGYTTAPTVTISGSGRANATAIVSGGKVTSIVIGNNGIGYNAAPTITFSDGGGSGATATATIYTNSNVDLPANLSVTTFMDSLMKERYREFAGESLRKQDLIRWNRYIKAMEEARNYIYSVGLTLDANTNRELRLFNATIAAGSKYLLFPIPSSEIQSNKLMEQNPGW